MKLPFYELTCPALTEQPLTLGAALVLVTVVCAFWIQPYRWL